VGWIDPPAVKPWGRHLHHWRGRGPLPMVRCPLRQRRARELAPALCGG